jgi:D-galactarolactone isomerase
MSDLALKALPAGACDSHMHVYHHSYPRAPVTLLHPPDATVDDYRNLQRTVTLDRVVVVQPTTYGLDNSCTLDAVAQLGDAARAVVVVDAALTKGELATLTQAGARGARFHMLPGGAVDWDQLEPVAGIIAEAGWHIQLQLNGRELPERFRLLSQLPVDLVVDHVGRFMPPVEVDDEPFAILCRLLDRGHTWVKLSAPYESSDAGSATGGPPDYLDVTHLADELVKRYPERLVWGSNWPHPGRDRPPTAQAVRRLLERWVPPVFQQRILVDNPARLYGFDR